MPVPDTCPDTLRLHTRPFTEEDIDAFCRLVDDGELCRMMGLPDLSKRADAEAEGRHFASHDTIALEAKADGRLVGLVSLEIARPFLDYEPMLAGKRGISLSFAIGRDFQGQGYATEALQTIIPWVMADLHLDYVNCGYFHYNTASAALQKKLGFQYCCSHLVHRYGQEIETLEGVLFREDIRW